MTFKRVFFTFIVTQLIISLIVDNTFAKNQTKSNEEILAEVTTTLVLSNIRKTVPDSARIVVITRNASAFTNWLQQILTDSCLQQNYLVYSSPGKDTLKGYQIQITDAQSSIWYHKWGRKWFFFSRGIERKISTTLHLQIMDPDGRILVSQKLNKTIRDTLAGSKIDNIENKQLNFTIGQWKTNTFKQRWLEPIVITATTATVIVLFYTLRNE
ncbi:MAG: hypothetical protein D6748_05410 [Calditrichaeota bacterium]|nr:MAG: hypothetical protein D6748_05410 [Calditrichota bacterium]